ncbi:MAG: glycosyltransferase [Acidobacteria bacterium]|nr:glycosyltransferase [Acidobacteriota bacterium]
MKVAQIGVAHPYRGGIAHYTTSLHQALLQQGHDSRVISFRRLYPSLLFPGVSQFDRSNRHFPIDSQNLLDSLNPLTWVAAAKSILQQAPDVVVFQYWHPYFAPVYATIVSRLRSRGVPSVFICHNVTPHERHLAAAFLRDRAFSRVERFLVHSLRDCQTLQELRPEAKVVKARHPVYLLFGDPPLSREAARENLGLPPQENIILFFGHVRAYKGLDVLLRSMPRILKRQMVRLLVAGEFYGSRPNYDRLLRNLGLQSYVTIHDHYVSNESVALYFKAANLLVLPYRNATQSGIIPTAYFFELPVVTTSVGGLPEAVLDGKTGFLVPPENPAALAEAVSDYFQSAREAAFRGEIRQFKEQFSWSHIVAGIELLASAGGVAEPAGIPAKS